MSAVILRQSGLSWVTVVVEAGKGSALAAVLARKGYTPGEVKVTEMWEDGRHRPMESFNLSDLGPIRPEQLYKDISESGVITG